MKPYKQWREMPVKWMNLEKAQFRFVAANSVKSVPKILAMHAKLRKKGWVIQWTRPVAVYDGKPSKYMMIAAERVWITHEGTPKWNETAHLWTVQRDTKYANPLCKCGHRKDQHLNWRNHPDCECKAYAGKWQSSFCQGCYLKFKARKTAERKRAVNHIFEEQPKATSPVKLPKRCFVRAPNKWIKMNEAELAKCFP